jgi:acid phosphatase type 7
MINRSVKILSVILIVFAACTEFTEIPAEKDESWSFVVFSDVQQGYGIYGQLAKNIANLHPAPLAAFCCGDIALPSANEAEWLSFNNCTEPLGQKMPLFIARGNHEENDPASETIFHQYSGNPSDSFYYTHYEQSTCFIVLDTYERGKEGSISGDQLEWLEQQLDSASVNSSVQHIILFMHQPLYPQGKHKGEDLTNADELHQLFLKHDKIRAVFSGHDHIFNRFVKDGINYITTGGGGGRLYRGYGGDYHHFVKVSFFNDIARINIKTLDIFNEVIEDFDL